MAESNNSLVVNNENNPNAPKSGQNFEPQEQSKTENDKVALIHPVPLPEATSTGTTGVILDDSKTNGDIGRSPDSKNNSDGDVYECSFSRVEVFQIWLANSVMNFLERSRHVLRAMLISVVDVENIDTEHLENRVNNICRSIERFWKNVNRTKSVFLHKYSDWLSVVEKVTLPRNGPRILVENEPQSSISCGRPRKDFSECTKRTKRRRISELSKSDYSTVSALLKDSRSSKLDLSKINVEEVLSLITEAKLSKHQYLLVKDFINTKVGSDILPSYHSILNSKKKCYPSNETISESSAEIELQSLLDHTATRILECQKEVLNMVAVEHRDTHTIILFGKWGFDGSSGHSEYKQTFSDASLQDSSLFVTSYVPLQLVMKPDLGNQSLILWKNSRPSSTRYCRPIRFQFLKETTEVSLQEGAYYKEKISNLKPTVFQLNDCEYQIKHSLQLTMVDGKVCSALSHTSSAKCYLCEATPKEMNKIDFCLQKEVPQTRFEFGLSPLHSWIRFYEYFIHLSYRLDIKKWQVRSSEEKQMLSYKKQHIQSQFRERLGLIVDQPRSGGSGTSNDGNSARKFFLNSVVSAEITGLNKDLLDRCCTILQCLSSGYNIDIEKFKEFSVKTARLLVQEYPWFNLPASVHKVLIHGSGVIERALLLIGELSEEAAEATNKHIKEFRCYNTRKMTRKLTNEDLLHRLLLNSDPFITSLRKLPDKKKGVLSKDILDLLRI